jgi:hypothetical protein
MRVFDRRVQFDERSRNFPIRALLGTSKPRSYTWSVGTHLNQQSEGACVAFAWVHELIARPVVKKGFGEAEAREIYKAAQKVDQWPGEAYSGTSVLAGAKVLKERGLIKEYRWAFGLDDLRAVLGARGPAVLGLNWYSGMFEPDGTGRIRPTGSLAGGHAILAFSNSEKHERIWLWNSWGKSWGVNGAAYLTHEDLDKLLKEQGEACIPVVR